MKENTRIEKFNCDILKYFQTLWSMPIRIPDHPKKCIFIKQCHSGFWINEFCFVGNDLTFLGTKARAWTTTFFCMVTKRALFQIKLEMWASWPKSLKTKFNILVVAYLQSWQRRRRLPMMQKLMLRKPLLTQPGSWKKFADDLHLRLSCCFPFAVKNTSKIRLENYQQTIKKSQFGRENGYPLNIFTSFGMKTFTF